MVEDQPIGFIHLDAVGDGDFCSHADLGSRRKDRKQLRLRKLSKRGGRTHQDCGGYEREFASHGKSHRGMREKSEAQKRQRNAASGIASI